MTYNPFLGLVGGWPCGVLKWHLYYMQRVRGFLLISKTVGILVIIY